MGNRIELSAQERRELWDRWKQGETVVSIARSLQRSPDSLRRVVVARGGIAPPERTRSTRSLALGEREKVSRGLSAGHSFRQIAAGLGRAPSTISREVARHGGRERYRAVDADERAWALACRPKPCRLMLEPNLR